MSISVMKRALDVLAALDTLFSPVARDSTQRAWIHEAKESIDALRAAIQQATQVPMTDELCWQIWEKAGACDEVNERVTLKVAKPIIRAIVAAYLEVAATRGITAQTKKEKE